MDVTTLAVPFLQHHPPPKNTIRFLRLNYTQNRDIHGMLNDELVNIHAAFSISSWESDPILGGGCVGGAIATILELPVEVV